MPPANHKTIPLNAVDQWKPIDNIRSRVFFAIQGFINEQLLKESLDLLIRDHLRVLGSRLKPTGENGALEYHLPDKFEEGYPLYGWSTRSISSAFQSSELLPAPQLSQSAVAWGSSITSIEETWTPPEWPVERKDEEPDTPLLLVHINTYKDATILATSLPHSVADQMGYASMVKAWLQVAGGNKPPTFLQIGDVRLDGKKDIPRQELRKKGSFRLMGRDERIRALAGFLPELIQHQIEERRMIFLSSAYIEKKRDDFNQILKRKHGPDALQVTNSDVVVAVNTKLGQLYRKKPKMLTLTGAVNARGRLPCLPFDQPYLHNALGFSCIRFPISRDTPLVDIAYYNRKAISEAVDPSEIDRSLTLCREMFLHGRAMHIIEPGDWSFATTNWSGAWRGIDFSPVKLKTSETLESDESGFEDRSNIDEKATYDQNMEQKSNGVPMLVLGHSMEKKFPHMRRFQTTIMCKAQGGYWCDFATPVKNMALVESLIEADPFLETL